MTIGVEDGLMRTMSMGVVDGKPMMTMTMKNLKTGIEVDDALFTGDALFMPDAGTGRCDFPKGSAADLYDSVREKLYALADETRVFVGHDYQPGGRELRFETTIGKSKTYNIALT